MMTRRGSGERVHLVEIQQAIDSKGPSGHPVQKWTKLTAIMASKSDAAGRERFAASQTTAPYDTTWQIAYLSSMDPDTQNIPKTRRIVYKARVYDIVSAMNLGFHRGIELDTLAGGVVR